MAFLCFLFFFWPVPRSFSEPLSQPSSPPGGESPSNYSSASTAAVQSFEKRNTVKIEVPKGTAPLLDSHVGIKERDGDLIKSAVQSYKAGEIQKAISQLDDLLAKNPEHSKAKETLIEVLVVASVESYLLGKEDESLQLLSRAMGIAPNVETVNRMYDKIRRTRLVAPNGERESRASLPARDAQTFQAIVEKVAQGQREILATTQNSMQKIVQSSAEEKKQILDSLDKRENILTDELKHGRKYFLSIVIGSFSLIILAVSGFLYLMQKIAARREKILMQQGEKFSQIFQEQSGKALEQLSGTLTALPQFSSRAAASRSPLLEDNTAEKLRRIDVIDAEIVQEDPETVRGELKVLDSLLGDPNPEVKARAIQALLKYNPDEAYRRIQEMLSDPQAESRLISVKLLSGIATKRSVEMLIPLLKDQDGSVKRQAIIALRSLANENLEEDAMEEVNLALSLVSEEEGWIVK